MSKISLNVAKCSDEKLEEFREYLDSLNQVIKDNQYYDADDDLANKEIAEVAKQLPLRSFIIPLNLYILLHTYQDADSDILKHPKWIDDMYEVLKEIDEYLANIGDTNIELRNKIKIIL